MGNYHALLAKSPAFYNEQAGIKPHQGPPSWVLDRLADEKFTGGYDVGPDNICGKCWQARSANGKCGCDL